MKWKQLKVRFAILVLLTAITLALAYKHNIDYQRHVQELIEEYTALGIDPGIVCPDPWQVWGIGLLVTFLGLITVGSWIVSSIIWFRGLKKRLLLRLLIAPLLIAIAGLLGWLSKITSIWQLKMVTGILAVLGVYVMAYACMHNPTSPLTELEKGKT